MEPSIPCTACTWAPERQRGTHYNSQVKLIYACSDRGVWSLGSNLILKDRGPRFPSIEPPNNDFVQKHTSIPVPTVIESWEEDAGPESDPEKHTGILMKRIPGESLASAWPKLSEDEKENIARQTAEYLLQLRNLQSDKVQTVDGGPIFSNFLFHARKDWLPHGPFASDDELWKEMALGLNEAVPETARRRLRERMPPATPYTYTHSDLTNVNIMVENGPLTGIIDWEVAGYYPVWWEYVCTSVPDSEEDREWKTLLRKYLPEYEEARQFWIDFYYLCRDLENERAVRFIKEVEGEGLRSSE